MKEWIFSRLRTGRTLLLAAVFIIGALVFLCEGFYRLNLSARADPADGQPGFDLHVMGESTMEGAPFYKSPAAIIYLLFSGELAGRPLRVKNLAFGGNSIYPQAIKTLRALKYRNRKNPAVLLIYAGHNERMLMNERPPMMHRLFETFKKRVLIHSLLFSELVLRAERFYNFHGARDLAHYEFYLSAVIEAALKSGALPVISTLTSNLSCTEPDLDRLTPGLEEGLKLERSGRLRAAAEQYARLAAESVSGGANSSLLPYLEYRQGRCLQAMGKPATAKIHLLKALETDADQYRAKPSQNEVIRRLARKYAIPLLDAEALFMEHSADGLPGKDLFVDHVHPTAEGYLLLSRALAGLLAKVFGDRIRNDIRDTSYIFAAPGKRPDNDVFPFSLADRGKNGRPAYPDPKFDDPATPYILAGTYILWFSRCGVPIPDRLALAENNFRKAVKLSGGSNLAAIGLRVVTLSRKNRGIIPTEVYAWFNEKRPNFEFLKPFTEEELGAVDIFLRNWERSV